MFRHQKYEVTRRVHPRKSEDEQVVRACVLSDTRELQLRFLSFH